MNPPPPDALRVPVTEEQLDIRRRRVDSGRPVRLRKEVLETPSKAGPARAKAR